ncbi:MAG: hypothetical protein ACOX4H_12420 [Bacillota bacterium]|jgi:hypothetical protein|nr:hypothetical protein [Clostridia bacterium]
MAQESLQKFMLRLKQVLDEPWDLAGPKGYIHLKELDEVTREMLNRDTGFTEANPLIDAFNLIIEQAQNLYAENIVFGINEIYKTYLKKISVESQVILTHRVMDCMKMLFQFFITDSFPYTERIWETFSSMTKPVGLFLIKEGFWAACPVFFESTALLGKQAARKGLSTGTLQHAFRISELTCRNLSHWELASLLQNLRQNLES